MPWRIRRYARVHESGAGARSRRSISERTSGPSDASSTSCSPASAPFRARPSPDTIAAVLEHEPDWQALPAKTPRKSATCCGSVFRRTRPPPEQHCRRSHDYRGRAAWMEPLAILRCTGSTAASRHPNCRDAPAARVFGCTTLPAHLPCPLGEGAGHSGDLPAVRFKQLRAGLSPHTPRRGGPSRRSALKKFVMTTPSQPR